MLKHGRRTQLLTLWSQIWHASSQVVSKHGYESLPVDTVMSVANGAKKPLAAPATSQPNIAKSVIPPPGSTQGWWIVEESAQRPQPAERARLAFALCSTSGRDPGC
jgi:hypothetical protein